MNPSIYSQAAANGTSRRFALIDARHVEDTYLLKRCGGTPALRCPDPILEPAQAYGTVLRETNGAWRMYYLHGRFKKDPSRPQDNLGYIMRLALSNDGISWSKPDLGPEGADESGDNNVIMGKHYVDARGQDLTGNTGPEGFCILDAEQQTLPHVRGRYTCLFLAGPSDRYGGLCLAHSDNGIRWHGYPENPLIPGWHDTSACMFYDPRIERSTRARPPLPGRMAPTAKSPASKAPTCWIGRSPESCWTPTKSMPPQRHPLPSKNNCAVPIGNGTA